MSIEGPNFSEGPQNETDIPNESEKPTGWSTITNEYEKKTSEIMSKKQTD